MKLENAIFDHGMELPDIANFKECNGKIFPDHVNTNSIYSELKNSIDKRDFTTFRSTITQLLNLCDQHITLTQTEKLYRAKQIKRVSEFTSSYINRLKTLTDRNDIPSNKAFEALYEEGIYASTIDTSRISNIIRDDYNKLIDNPPFTFSGPYDRGISYKAENNPTLFSELSSLFKTHGIFDAASKYNNLPTNLKIDLVTLHISDPGDTHHNNTLNDCTEKTKLLGMHFDPKFSLVKSIIYLNNVDIDSGPFSFVPSSHRWYFDEVESLFARGNSVGNYLGSPEHRQASLSMPKLFRKNAIFGRLIPDGSALSNQLLSVETRYVSNLANCMVFDPSTGFHRGGLCSKGTRINLQITMR